MKFIRLHGRALLLAAAAMIAVLLGCMITSEDADSETWGAWTVTTPATCYAAGMETRTSVKDATHKETRPIAQLTGTACDAETWGPWVTTTPATCSAPGVETRTSAQDANRKENRAIPQLTGTACGASPGTDLGGNGGGSASYESVTIGGKTWMRHNLNIATDNSWCYGGDGANCDRYGRLYTWNAAKTACPSGWGLPSRQDWQGLATAAGGDATGGGKLKAAGGWYEGGNGTDALGFSALPGGYRAADGGFRNAGSIAFWWTASEHDGGKAYYRSMFYEDGRVTEAARDMNSAHSVRCVQNAAVPPVNPPSTPVTPTPVYTVTVVSEGSGAGGGGNYAAGSAVLIHAGTPPGGQQFKNWTTTTSGVSFADANNATTAFTMPASAVTVTAVFEASGGTAPGTTLYTVTVSGGTGATGTGSYAAGSTVTISAGTPPSGQTFKNWTTASGGVSFADANSATTAFIMPGNAVTVAAVFEAVGGTAPGTTMYTVMVSGGTGAAGTGSYAAGSTVTISAGTPPSGQTFKNWTAVGVSLANANSSQTTFIMPSNAVTVTANFETTGGTTPGGGGGVAGSTNTKETALLVRENNSYTQTIGYNGEHWFKLVGTGSEPVIIETKGDVVDTYMEVEYETTSFYPRSDNDGGEGKNAKLTFNAVSGETYFIKITTRSGTYGAYTFVVTKVDPCNIQTNATPVLVGSSTRRSIYPNCQHWYTFVGDGSRVSFEAEGGVVNATIRVYKGTSAIYSEYNKKISIITIPGQTYDIQITSNNSGTYTFKLSNGPGDGSSKYDAIEVVRGGSYTSTIDYDGENWFMYQGTGLPPVTFETIGNVVDTYMEVAYETTSFYPYWNDDGGDGKNARLTFTAVLWETYFIKITQRSQTRGAYTFVVE